MKKVACLFILLVMVSAVKAQIVSMNKREVAKMRAILKKDKRYQDVFEPYKQAAYQTLKDTPNPIAIILSQGLLAGDPRKTASLKALEDVNKIYALAITYRVLKDKTLLDKATQFLLAWAKTNKATPDPINETKLEDVVIAYDLVREKFNSSDKATIDAWMHNKADSLLNSKYAKGSRGTAVNNWNSH